MKRIVFTLILASALTVTVLAQTPSAGSCFDEYYSLFRQRGAKKVTDGDQTIVVSIKKDNVSRCLMGKVAVKNGEFVPPVYLEKADGTFEEFRPELSPAFANVTLEMRRRIEDGMTITFITTDNETVKGFFIGFLADKPKANKAAPSAKTL
jgi:hypothetical protein